MGVIIRKNIVTFSLVFTAADGSATQPSAAVVNVSYSDLSAVAHTTQIPLTNTNGAWIGSWDSSASGDGTVYWMAYGYGTLQASTQGSFEVGANPANTL